MDVHEKEILLELSGASDNVAIRVEDGGAAVEDELVLAADKIAENDVASVVRGPDTEHPLPGSALETVIRGGGDVQEDACPSNGLLARGTTRVPDILADAQAHESGAKLEERGA
jgi:hypothetical protein